MVVLVAFSLLITAAFAIPTQADAHSIAGVTKIYLDGDLVKKTEQPYVVPDPLDRGYRREHLLYGEVRDARERAGAFMPRPLRTRRPTTPVWFSLVHDQATFCGTERCS